MIQEMITVDDLYGSNWFTCVFSPYDNFVDEFTDFTKIDANEFIMLLFYYGRV